MAQDSTDLGAFYNDQVSKAKIWQVIGASAVGTMIEWYDFYIFGSLAPIIAPLFYPPGNDTFAYIAYLATFAVGFVVRPFGALFFGRIGDVVGRKYAFLVTLLIMGGSTAIIGFLPTYAVIGIAAPVILLLVRVLQGLALGGEYGGAAVYVAEHVPDNRRGFYTSFIQITATLGHPGGAEYDVGGRVRGARRGACWLAHTVSHFHSSGGRFAIHPAEDGGIAHFPPREIDRDDLG
jgi:hypothetical protein